MRFCYYGHSFHERSQSTAFLLDIIRKLGEVDVFKIDPDERDDCHRDIVEQQSGRQYDCHIFFQAEQVAERLRPVLSGRFVIVPMYDGARMRPDTFWQQFVNTRFISFSRVHHEHLQALECQSSHFGFFPEPGPIPERDFENPSAFFWERRPDRAVNEAVVLDLCRTLGVQSLHIHSAPDFARHSRPAPRPGRSSAGGIAITRTSWFGTRSDYLDVARRPIFYFAPRPEEGIGMAFLEAMSCGQVVVAPYRPTMNEYIRHGTTGILYDPEAPDISLSLDAAALRRIGDAAARRIAFGRADWQLDVERLESILLDDKRRWSTDDVSSHYMNALLRSASSRAFRSAAAGGTPEADDLRTDG